MASRKLFRSLTATGTSAINLPGINNQADSTGVGDLFTTFTITGGTGAVDVTFTMDLSASQDGTTDAFGYVRRNELVATLTVMRSLIRCSSSTRFVPWDRAEAFVNPSAHADQYGNPDVRHPISCSSKPIRKPTP